ncbi:FAD-dependent oxidoreductase [Nocardioides albus]|uniref:ferredoxin--NADP(+) reductase n=1 Tax=Nocardioides albus TaxID=1841 RepID=A0A7W5A9J1_9ACTN|nr:FAD-dependent oxidoreductase [Nocardioides albus]MBB3091834.1 ferredoxin--NADP+ reductase [Nocardioides albus]GGU31528.1 ferredoxin [Nocardioides albus]
MPHVVTQSCCADASCVVACPVNCIHPAPGEPGFGEAEMLYVDAKSCVDCGACVTACPADAIVPHTTLTAAQEPFLAINAEYFEVFPHKDRTPLALVHPQRRLTRTGPFRVAVVGAGPAGMYAADELLKHPEINVDVFDRLPTPYGLVRAGVAPDHQNTKQVEKLFAQVESQPGFRYFLGVEVGKDVSHAELTARYHAVVYTVGAASDRALGIEGDDLPGSLSATDFVGWYNGHPDKQDLPVHLDAESIGSGRVVLVGNGNVALDCARILAEDPERLASTDVADGSLAVLRESAVREVVVLGRRGPGEAAFTVPELVGLMGHAGVNVAVDTGDLPLEEALAGGETTTRLLREISGREVRPELRTVVLRFLSSPVRVLGTERVTGVEVGRNRLERDENGVVRAVPTGETEVLETGMLLRAVGYKGLPVADLPYDAATGTVPNERGRVLPGVYVAGWVKRGPNGFIGTNKSDAEETVDQLLDDLDADRIPAPVGDAGEITAVVRGRQPGMVDLAGWQAIDREEKRRGAEAGRPRVKITDVEEMRGIAAKSRKPRYSLRRRKER